MVVGGKVGNICCTDRTFMLLMVVLIFVKQKMQFIGLCSSTWKQEGLLNKYASKINQYLDSFIIMQVCHDDQYIAVFAPVKIPVLSLQNRITFKLYLLKP